MILHPLLNFRRREVQITGHPFKIELVYFEGKLPVGPTGKFEEFVSRLDDGHSKAAV